MYEYFPGLSVGLKRDKEVSDLMSLCRQLKLKSFNSLATPVSGLTYPISGPAETSAFKEIDPPAASAVTTASKFMMHSPKDSR